MPIVSKLIVCAALAVLLTPGSSHAKWVQGEVVGVDPEQGYVRVIYTTDEGSEDVAEVWVHDDTEYHGVESLGEVEEGQEVLTSVTKDKRTGNWMARILEVDFESDWPLIPDDSTT